jgi:hypothetical protein
MYVRKQLVAGGKQLVVISSTRFIQRRRIRFEYGFGFSDLYHPYVEALKSGSEARATILLRDFYESMHLYINSMPSVWDRCPIQAWGNDSIALREEILKSDVPSGQFTNFSGGYLESARIRARRLFGLANAIQSDRMTLLRTFWRSPITGLRVGKSVLIQGGQHRVAILGFLGFSAFPVTIRSRRILAPRNLVEQSLPLVRRGTISIEEAGRILSRIRLGLSTSEALANGFPFANPPRTSAS